ncbi:MAG: hypothetical protein VB082_06610 [Christensenella sp.]|nr:hypothetical protein [Christensenella sp.]
MFLSEDPQPLLFDETDGQYCYITDTSHVGSAVKSTGEARIVFSADGNLLWAEWQKGSSSDFIDSLITFPVSYPSEAAN